MNRISPALEEAIIPAFETRESVRVDFPWSTCAMTDMFRMLVGLSVARFRQRRLSNHATTISREFLKLFRSLFTQTNGKLLTHKRTDFVDGEARALLVLIPRRRMYDRCHKTPGGKERRIGNQILSKPSRSTCCSFPPLPVHLQAFSLPPVGFAHPYLRVQERLT